MAVKKLRPTTPGQRFRIAPVFDDVTSDKPEKSLIRSHKSKGGRNNQGRMTVRNVGGGHKKKLREKQMEEAVDACTLLRSSNLPKEQNDRFEDYLKTLDIFSHMPKEGEESSGEGETKAAD